MRNCMKKQFKQRLALITLSSIMVMTQLTACAPILLGAVGVGASISSDRRPTGLQTSDKGLQIQILGELSKDYPNHTIEVAVWNGHVLVLGQVPNSAIAEKINQSLAKFTTIKKLYNEIKVEFSNPLNIRTHDGLLTTRLKTSMLATQNLNSGSVKIVTSGGKVYLMGWLLAHEVDIALNVARTASGVVEVVNLIEVVNY